MVIIEHIKAGQVIGEWTIPSEEMWKAEFGALDYIDEDYIERVCVDCCRNKSSATPYEIFYSGIRTKLKNTMSYRMVIA